MCGLSAELKRKQIKSATGLLPAINKTILSESVYFLGIKTQKKHKYPITTPSMHNLLQILWGCTSWHTHCGCWRGRRGSGATLRSAEQNYSAALLQEEGSGHEMHDEVVGRVKNEGNNPGNNGNFIETEMSPATRRRGKFKLKTNLKLIWNRLSVGKLSLALPKV